MNKNKLLFPLVLLVLVGCAPIRTYETRPTPASPVTSPETPSPEAGGIKVRVAIAARQYSVHLLAPENFVLSGFPMDGTPVVREGEKSFREATLTSDKLYSHKAYIEPLGEGEIQVNGKGYRGKM